MVTEAARAEVAWMEDLSARVVRVAPAGSAEESVVVSLPLTDVGTVQAAELAEECGVARSPATDPPGL